MMQRLRPHYLTILLGLILLVAAAFRLSALNFALPNVYHPDEDLLVIPAMNMIKTGDFNPLRMDHGSFFIYSLAFVHLLVYLYSARGGWIGSVNELTIPVRVWYPSIYPHPEYVLAGRVLSVAFGMLLIVAVYLLGMRLGNRRMGLMAAAIAAVTPEFVVQSHYAVTDMAMVSMSALSLYLLLRAYDHWESGSPWAYIGAGFVCGLTASTKFTGAMLVVPLLLVPLLKVRRWDDVLSLRVIGGPAAMALGFITTTPYALLDLPKFVHFTSYVLRVYNQPGYDAPGDTWRWQLNYLFTDRNMALAFPAAAGLLVSLFRWGRRGWIVNSFALLILAMASTTSARETRTWMPLAPIACVWAALALDTALLWLRRRLPGRSADQAALYGLLVLLVLLALTGRSAEAIRNLRGPDVRTLVQTWIEANVPPGSGIVFDRFPANLDPNRWPVTLIFGHYDQSLDDYRDKGIRFVVASDVIQSEERLSVEDMTQFRAMTEQLCLAQTITGPFLAANDRTYWIYEMPPCSLPAQSP
jgi:4-amino-4-deoxy-L-arabinose transferase-like glycosyltransferase